MVLVDLSENDANRFPTDDAVLGANETARAKLKSHGLRVVRLVEKDNGEGGSKTGLADALCDEQGWATGYLAVAYATNKGISDVFARSEWANGGWVQSLGKIEGALPPRKIRFAGKLGDNALLVPLAAFRGDEG